MRQALPRRIRLLLVMREVAAVRAVQPLPFRALSRCRFGNLPRHTTAHSRIRSDSSRVPGIFERRKHAMKTNPDFLSVAHHDYQQLADASERLSTIWMCLGYAAIFVI